MDNLRKYGRPFTDYERLINHFGYTKAMQLLEDYGEEAYRFLPERGAKLRLGQTFLHLGDKTDSYASLQEIEDMVEFRIPIGNFFKRIARGVVKAAKGVFNVGKWILTRAWLIARLPIIVPIAAQACIRKKKVPKTARELHNILIEDPIFKKAFADLCRKSKKRKRKRVGSIQMRIADINASLNQYGIAELLEDELPSTEEEDVGLVSTILSLATIILPLVLRFIQARQQGATTQEALNTVQNSQAWMDATSLLSQDPDKPIGSVKTSFANEVFNWFSKNWWLPMMAVGGVLFVVSMTKEKSQPMPYPYSYRGGV